MISNTIEGRGFQVKPGKDDKFEQGDKVVLLPIATKWGTRGPFYRHEGLEIGNIYTVSDYIKPEGSTIGYLSLYEGENHLVFPDWCFKLHQKNNSGKNGMEGIDIIFV